MHSQVMDDAKNVHNVFPFDLEDEPVDGDEGAGAAHASAESRRGRRPEVRHETLMRPS